MAISNFFNQLSPTAKKVLAHTGNDLAIIGTSFVAGGYGQQLFSGHPVGSIPFSSNTTDTCAQIFSETISYEAGSCMQDFGDGIQDVVPKAIKLVNSAGGEFNWQAALLCGGMAFLYCMHKHVHHLINSTQFSQNGESVRLIQS